MFDPSRTSLHLKLNSIRLSFIHALIIYNLYPRKDVKCDFNNFGGIVEIDEKIRR